MERELEIELPLADLSKGINPWSKSECEKTKAFSERLGSTFNGRLVNIEFFLNVFVKHDSWNEFGEGNCISIPIRLKQPLIAFPFYKSVDAKRPDDWAPHVEPL